MSNLSRRDFAMTAGLAAAAGIGGQLSVSPDLGNQPDKKNVDDPASFTHRFATVNGIRMHYVEEGKGPLVILLHGYPFLWYLWRHQIKALAAAGYRVVAPDQRGYGQTDCPKDVDAYDMTRLVGDVVGLMKALNSKSAGSRRPGLWVRPSHTAHGLGERVSFLDGAIVQQPALFLTGDHDPSTRPVFGIDRQEPPIKSLRTNFRDLREIITMPGVGHTPPEERPEEINAIVLKFLKEFGF